MLDILILTADLMCLLAFYSVYRCVKTRGAKGVSIQSFVAFAVGRTLHTSSHLIGVHYNPTSLAYALYLSVDFANVLLGLLASLQLYLRSQPYLLPFTVCFCVNLNLFSSPIFDVVGRQIMASWTPPKGLLSSISILSMRRRPRRHFYVKR